MERRPGYARAELVEVVEASPDRVAPPCQYVAAGCGGCRWQHVDRAAQARLKRDVVADALRRQARLPHAPVGDTVLLPPGGRTSVRVLTPGGRPAFRRHRGHEPVRIDACLAAHPLVDEVLRHGRFDGAEEAAVRAGARTGERLVVAHPSAARLALPAGVAAVGSDELEQGATAAYHEVAGGRRWRISALSFFQSRPDGADALVGLVRDAVGGARRVTDLYAGVGLFAGVLADAGARVVAVEGDAGAAADARENLAGLAVEVVHADVHGWEPVAADVVVADPSRRGLGTLGTAAVTGGDPARVVLVSCDAAALGRDVALLAGAGYALVSVTPVDLFPDTPHVEAVAVLDRA